jgi:hypothetical protein
LQSGFELINSFAFRDGQVLQLYDLVDEHWTWQVNRLAHLLQTFTNPGGREIAQAGESADRFRFSQRFFPLGVHIVFGAEVFCGLPNDCGRKRDDHNGGASDLI